MNFELHTLNQWLTVNNLSLNIAKTEFVVIDSITEKTSSGRLVGGRQV